MIMSKFGIFADLWHFLRIRKKWWMLPILLVIVLLAMLMLFAQSAPVLAPFIYTIF